MEIQKDPLSIKEPHHPRGVPDGRGWGGGHGTEALPSEGKVQEWEQPPCCVWIGIMETSDEFRCG